MRILRGVYYSLYRYFFSIYNYGIKKSPGSPSNGLGDFLLLERALIMISTLCLLRAKGFVGIPMFSRDTYIARTTPDAGCALLRVAPRLWRGAATVFVTR